MAEVWGGRLPKRGAGACMPLQSCETFECVLSHLIWRGKVGSSGIQFTNFNGGRKGLLFQGAARILHPYGRHSLSIRSFASCKTSTSGPRQDVRRTGWMNVRG